MIVISREVSDQLASALGKALLAVWGRLPSDVQHEIFEEAVASQGDALRPHLAVLLHDKHPRTCASTRAMLEPDSLGG